MESVRRKMARVMEILQLMVRGVVYTTSEADRLRAAADVRDEVLPDRAAAGRARVDGSPGGDGGGRQPGRSRAAVAGVQLPNAWRRRIAEEHRRAAPGQRNDCPLEGLLVGVGEAADGVRREPCGAVQWCVRRVQIDEVVAPGIGERRVEWQRRHGDAGP